MLNLKFNNLNDLNKPSFPKPSLTRVGDRKVAKSNSICIIECEDHARLAHIYKDIFVSTPNEQKWVLMINPEVSALKKLSETQENYTNKILKINTQKVNMNINNVRDTLEQGNCAKVVICNPAFNKSDLVKLEFSALKGNTQCVILKTNQTLH